MKMSHATVRAWLWKYWLSDALQREEFWSPKGQRGSIFIKHVCTPARLAGPSQTKERFRTSNKDTKGLIQMDLKTKMSWDIISLEKLYDIMTDVVLLLRFVVRILNSVLELSTDLLGRLLGNQLVRRHFHLLLSGLLLFGPVFNLWASNYSILTNANNYLYRKFLKSVWGWTFLLSGSFIILLSLSSRCSFLLCLRHLSRIILVGLIWVGCRKVLTLLEDAAGSCYEPVDTHISSSSSSSSFLLLLHEDQTKSSCLRANLQWRGYEVSQEVLVLCLSSLLLVEEISVFGRHVAQMKTPDPSLRIIFLLCVVLLLLWMFLLLCLLAYFPKFPSQQLGGALGYLGWRVLYQGWYQLGPSWACLGIPEPGLGPGPGPGPGELLTSKDSEKHNLCVE